jgi:hypothetical protein
MGVPTAGWARSVVLAGCRNPRGHPCAISGRRAGMATGLGIASGVFVWPVVAAFGVASLLAASAVAFTVVKLVGAVYLAYLGVKALISAWRRGEALAVEGRVATVSPWVGYRQCLVTNLLNPKCAVFFVALMPQFLSDTPRMVTHWCCRHSRLLSLPCGSPCRPTSWALCGGSSLPYGSGGSSTRSPGPFSSASASRSLWTSAFARSGDNQAYECQATPTSVRYALEQGHSLPALQLIPGP